MRQASTYLSFSGLLLLSGLSTAQAGQLDIQLSDAPATGTVTLLLFDSPNSFGDMDKALRVETYTLDGRASYTLEDVPAGEYALVMYHDENENGRIDKNFIGIPKEPLGYANNYRPKGPPSYARAAFTLDSEDARRFEVQLARPLGERGRWGAGLGVIASTSPYRDYDSGVYQVIPALSYNGERLQLFGPNVQLGLAGTGKLRLAAKGSYRPGAYEEDESDYLAGMGDREVTFLAGPALQLELPAGMDLAASYEHDVLDQIGGGVATLQLDKSFQVGSFNLSPAIAVNWFSQEIANHDFGVPAEKATADRPEYRLNDATSIEIGLGIFAEIGRDWLLVMRASVERLDDDITSSPLVSEDYVVKGFAAVNYLFGD